MSSLFNHLFIPLILLLLFADQLGFDRKKIITLSFFGIFPDIDAFILVHRASFHNLFILIIPIILFIILKEHREILGIIIFYLVSHLVLDIFNGGIYYLYPYYEQVFFFRAESWFSNGYIDYLIDYGINGRIVSPISRESIISSESVGIIVLIIYISIWIILKHRRLIYDKGVTQLNIWNIRV